jgi:N,N'-diacetyllegionaminate synthase
MDGIFIIAEAGVNHNGSIETARKLIDAAASAGADAVKFQTFKAEDVATAGAGKAEYQKAATQADEPQCEMLRRLELGFGEFAALKRHADEAGILFLSTGFDRGSVEFLSRDLGVPILKVPSGEITNLPLLEAVAAQGKPVFLSTGMSTVEEIGAALDALRAGGAGEVTLLQCTTEYPAPFSDVNLSAMGTLRDRFGTQVGYSDHTEGIEAALAAAALGATVIEKHFTLDRGMEGPDHRASLEPQELKAMVEAIRHVESALGNGEKTVAASESGNRNAARKSIVAARPIRRGELFTEDNLAAKRPGTGLSPMLWHDVVGRVADRDYAEEEQITI